MSYLERSDEEILTELSLLATWIDPVPAEVREQASASLLMASPWDVELAQLIYDSATDDHDARLVVRGGVGTREITFEGPTLTVEVEIGPCESMRPGRCQILGQLVPAGSAHIELRHPSGSLLAEADEMGRFAVQDAPTGPVSLRCTPLEGMATDTEWMLI